MAYYFGDAITEIKKIKGKSDGHLDYATLPPFARKISKIPVYVTTDVVNNGKITKKIEKIGEKDEESRDLGAMISILTVAVQQLVGRVEKLEDLKK